MFASLDSQEMERLAMVSTFNLKGALVQPSEKIKEQTNMPLAQINP